MIQNNFSKRHNGPREHEVEIMLETIGVKSLDQLIDETIPSIIRLKKDLDLPEGISEYEYYNEIKEIAGKNKVFKSFIGQGYYEAIFPAVIQRNIFENPSWYTSYTPYQAEISQGRLEALLNFQTMVSDLTGLPIANASLLDEGTAAAEAMLLSFGSRSRVKIGAGANVYLVDQHIFPQTLEVLKTRAISKGIEIKTIDSSSMEMESKAFGILLQYPNSNGEIVDYKAIIELAHSMEMVVTLAADIMSLALLKSPAELGADISVGSTQRFGIPMGFGGPHAAFFATTETYKRSIPGRIIGVSKDMNGRRALRMALQTREQHIKREKATSNICTAQALLATMAGMYAVYHGQEGIKAISTDIHAMAVVMSDKLSEIGYKQLNINFYDTLRIELPVGVYMRDVKKFIEEKSMNFNYVDDKIFTVSFDEAKSIDDINIILQVLAALNGKEFTNISNYDFLELKSKNICKEMLRESDYLTHPVFNSYHSETEMMRYIKKLENKDLALNTAMIPLGSCTMKLNAAVEMLPLSWVEFGNIHPFAPSCQVAGYKKLIDDLGTYLTTITGFDSISFQPNSGAAGEYAGLLTIMEYHKSRGEGHRNICLIPASAHGTNPASAVMASMNVVVVKTDEHGEIDMADLNAKAEQHKDNLAALMVTYPSTHGVFEESILDVVKIIHDNGGQVYMDGANMNAQVGFTNPGIIGADVCHLNLHKTFAIPHGGGGPGVGPIACAKHLTPFLPSHFILGENRENLLSVSSAPYGSALVLPISYGYIRMLGGSGLKQATAMAILNANYMKSKLENHYKVLYSGANNRVAHELILDCNEFSKTAHIQVIDIAKRLMDYGFHAPTVAFPVHGTLMVEPTESEPLSEIDRFIEAMIAIREEIREVEEGKASMEVNIVNQAPHTMSMVMDEWTKPYDKMRAAFPTDEVKESKFWPTVTKIDDGFGDRNLMCTCEPIESYI